MVDSTLQGMGTSCPIVPEIALHTTAVAQALHDTTLLRKIDLCRLML